MNRKIGTKKITKSPSKSKGEIRIIGGQWRGRKLPVINHQGLRPTTDRIKETLFNWLMPIVCDTICLDCYAGSGSLGIEAVSRGSSQATLLEKDKTASAQLTSNQARLNTDKLTIVNTDSLDWLNNLATMQFNLVFIDPPFNQNLVPKTISLLESNNWLKNQAWVYIETEITARSYSVPQGWQLHREKLTNQVCYRVYHRDID